MFDDFVKKCSEKYSKSLASLIREAQADFDKLWNNLLKSLQEKRAELLSEVK